MRREKKVAIVTGGNRGIGRAIVLKLADRGCHIAIVYLPSSDADRGMAAETAEKVRETGARALIIETDIGSRSQVESMVDRVVRELGGINILVNNAGVSGRCDFLKITEEEWDRVMNTNLKGAFFCSQAVARHMVKKGGGKIVNVSSTAAVVAIPKLIHYCTSKAGIKMLTQAMALELGHYGINVNAVGPSTTATEMTRKYLENQDILEKEIKVNPMRRLGTPGDIADAVAFLASEESRQINGHLLMVDGGLTIRSAQPDLD